MQKSEQGIPTHFLSSENNSRKGAKGAKIAAQMVKVLRQF
jgi:hypothetical protein